MIFDIEDPPMLTPEREEEIRQWAPTQFIGTSNAITELLAEIDRLRAALKIQTETNILIEFKKTIEERDRLKTENERLAQELINTQVEHPCYKLSKELESENASLRSRVVKLREALRRMLASEALKNAEFYWYCESICDAYQALAADDEMEGT